MLELPFEVCSKTMFLRKQITDLTNTAAKLTK